MIFDLNSAPSEEDGQGAPDVHEGVAVHGGEGVVDEQVHIPPIQYEEASFFDLNVHPEGEGVVVEEEQIPPIHVVEDEGAQLGVNAPFDLNIVPVGNDSNARRNHLSDVQRQEVYEALLERSRNGILQKDTTKSVAGTFGINRRVVQRIWTNAKQAKASGARIDIKSKKSSNCGRKRVQVDLEQVKSIPLNQRTTIRSLASAISISKTKMHKVFKEGLIRRHSSSLKPYLREENKKERLRFCISMIDPRTVHSQPRFIDMRNIVHMDEKWYNGTNKNKTMYLLPDEDDPLRTVQNKNSINKCMFLTLHALPRYDAAGNCYFDGKIGIFPFVKKEPAKRKSKNRLRGTLITKTINVKRETSKSFLISKVIPAIARCWPREDDGKTIWIQQDNAPSHVRPDDPDFALAVSQTGLDIRLMNQPPNSPDMNILDLGFFSSLQSKAYLSNSKTIDELVTNVVKEYNDYDPALVRRVFLTLQSCFIETMKLGGGNGYKIPHMNKDRLERLGMLPDSLTCDKQLYDSVLQSLSE